MSERRRWDLAFDPMRRPLPATSAVRRAHSAPVNVCGAKIGPAHERTQPSCEYSLPRKNSGVPDVISSGRPPMRFAKGSSHSA